jgi:hypothetical protein
MMMVNVKKNTNYDFCAIGDTKVHTGRPEAQAKAKCKQNPLLFQIKKVLGAETLTLDDPKDGLG